MSEAAAEGRGRALVLATDLDGTFAHGSADARAELVDAIAADPDARLIYVTGRTPSGAREVAGRVGLPQPDVLIADVGTSVLRGLGPDRVVPIEATLDTLWPGGAEVRSRLESVAELEEQEIIAPRRVSYWIEPVRRTAAARPAEAASTARAERADPFAARAPDDASLASGAEAIAQRIAAAARERLADLDVDVLVSANVFLDVLPRGVNKGTTLRRVLDWLGVADDACVVAGDSLNDLALFETGLAGIVVGNCEPALRRRASDLPSVYVARAEGVEGIVEGLRHHGRHRARARGTGADRGGGDAE